MIQSPEVQSKIAHIRARIASGEATLEEIREGVIMMREGRHASLDTAGKAKKKASGTKRPSLSADELDKLVDQI